MRNEKWKPKQQLNKNKKVGYEVHFLFINNNFILAKTRWINVSQFQWKMEF